MPDEAFILGLGFRGLDGFLTPPSPTTRPNLDVDKSGGNSGFGLCASHVRSTDSSWRATDGGRLKRGQSSKGVRVMA